MDLLKSMMSKLSCVVESTVDLKSYSNYEEKLLNCNIFNGISLRKCISLRSNGR